MDARRGCDGCMEMPQAIGMMVLAAVGGLIVGALFRWVRMKLRWGGELKAARAQSVSQARATLKGQIGEQLAPLLPGFQYACSDARFLGDPIDYVVFNGYTAMRDGLGGEASKVEVVILDIKRGNARLSEGPRAVAAAVCAGRVRFQVVRVADDGKVSIQDYTVGK